MQQLYEMLCYLDEALNLEDAQPIHSEMLEAAEQTDRLTNLNPKSILELHIPTHRAMVNDLLLQASELVRAKVMKKSEHSKKNKITPRSDLIGVNLRGADLRGVNLRGALLIASDLRDSDMRLSDLIGADLRDADLRGANLQGSIFLTQAQVNSANGDIHTKLPTSLYIPDHWLN